MRRKRKSAITRTGPHPQQTRTSGSARIGSPYQQPLFGVPVLEMANQKIRCVRLCASPGPKEPAGSEKPRGVPRWRHAFWHTCADHASGTGSFGTGRSGAPTASRQFRMDGTTRSARAVKHGKPCKGGFVSKLLPAHPLRPAEPQRHPAGRSADVEHRAITNFPEPDGPFPCSRPSCSLPRFRGA